MTILILHASLWNSQIIMAKSEKEFFVISEEQKLVNTSTHVQQISFFSSKLKTIFQEDGVRESITAIAVTCGPGSYTGIRLSISLAQGLSMGFGCPIIPLNNHQILASMMPSWKSCWVFTETHRLDFIGSKHLLVDDEVIHRYQSYTQENMLQLLKETHEKQWVIWKEDKFDNQPLLEFLRIHDQVKFNKTMVKLSMINYENKIFTDPIPLYIAPNSVSML